MPYLDRDGVHIWYEARGRDEHPLVLLSHGYSATGCMWDVQVDALRDRYRVVTWDMRGHGRSDSPDDPGAYSEQATVADMAAILDDCGAASAYIGGLSLGGFMSLAFHYRHPERVDALLLFDTGPGYKNDEARDGWNRNAEKRAEELESRGFQALSQSREVKARNHRSAQGLAHAARGMLAQSDARIIESLPAIAVPTLVLVGADDRPFLAATDYMTKKIASAHKVVIPDAGHASNIDQPAAFDSAVSGFLESLRTS
jgi:pimeloyl-ACP methyl ester carboxylesterase